jgi:diphthine-ammonia ligase
MKELIETGFHVIVTGVYAYGFDQKWLGRKIDRGALTGLVELNRKYRVSVVGEGGEYETLVLDAPLFGKKIRVVKAKTVWEKDSGYLLVEEALLEEKNS